jgi:hypothetical protein
MHTFFHKLIVGIKTFVTNFTASLFLLVKIQLFVVS